MADPTTWDTLVNSFVSRSQSDSAEAGRIPSAEDVMKPRWTRAYWNYIHTSTPFEPMARFYYADGKGFNRQAGIALLDEDKSLDADDSPWPRFNMGSYRTLAALSGPGTDVASLPSFDDAERQFSAALRYFDNYRIGIEQWLQRMDEPEASWKGSASASFADVMRRIANGFQQILDVTGGPSGDTGYLGAIANSRAALRAAVESMWQAYDAWQQHPDWAPAAALQNYLAHVHTTNGSDGAWTVGDTAQLVHDTDGTLGYVDQQSTWDLLELRVKERWHQAVVDSLDSVVAGVHQPLRSAYRESALALDPVPKSIEEALAYGGYSGTAAGRPPGSTDGPLTDPSGTSPGDLPADVPGLGDGTGDPSGGTGEGPLPGQTGDGQLPGGPGDADGGLGDGTTGEGTGPGAGDGLPEGLGEAPAPGQTDPGEGPGAGSLGLSDPGGELGDTGELGGGAGDFGTGDLPAPGSTDFDESGGPEPGTTDTAPLPYGGYGGLAGSRGPLGGGSGHGLGRGTDQDRLHQNPDGPDDWAEPGSTDVDDDPLRWYEPDGERGTSDRDLPGRTDESVWEPGTLQDYTPPPLSSGAAGSGSGPGAWAGEGTGVSGGRTWSGGAGLDGGAGADAAGAPGSTGAPGHPATSSAGGSGNGGVPLFPPMAGGGAGAGGGDQNKERERSTWLAEDEEVWGTDPDLAPAVLGRPGRDEDRRERRDRQPVAGPYGGRPGAVAGGAGAGQGGTREPGRDQRHGYGQGPAAQRHG